MSIIYGLTDDGFIPKSLQVVRADLNAALQAAFGQSIDLSDTSALGQLVGILAERYADLWSGLEAVYASQDPDKATATALDALCSLTGTTRPQATHSKVTLTLFGTPATVVPSGSLVATASTGKNFSTNANATIATVSPWANTTAYVVGNRVWNDTDKVYQCITAGTSAGSGGPTGTTSNITDGTVHWEFVGISTAHGAVDVAANSVDTGPVTGVAGDITTIINGVVGWVAVTNLLDAKLGLDLATDASLRLLRVLELSSSGQSTADAIRAALVEIVDIISVTVFINDTDTTNSDGMPPHSVECLVRPNWSPGDPLDQQIYDTVFANVAAGIVTTNSGTGAMTGSSTDSEGVSHVVKFTRPEEIDIYVILNVTVDSATFPTDGVSQIKANIITWGDTLDTGRDAVASAISARAFQIAGVLDVTSCFIGTAPAPGTSTTIPISTRQIAVYDTTRITVNTTPGTP